MTGTTGKVDLTRAFHALYTARADPVFVDVPEFSYLMIDGHGDPNTSPSYVAAVEALYSVAYAVKFALKRAGGPDFAVMPLEGLWWAADMSAFSAGDKSAWDWTMMIMQPDQVTVDLVGEARAKKGISAELGLRRLAEGRAAQLLHVGPYSAEGPNIRRLHAFIAEQGCRLAGKHHEIYLGDPRRAAPEKLRTIIRQPVAPSRPGR